MNNFEKIKNMSLEDLTNWIDEHGMYDNTPWMNWWNDNYCDRCESIIVKAEDAEVKLNIKPFCDEEYECAYCEVHDHCKFFPDRASPDVKEIITMWLEAEADG